jgi:hypothetical protein
MSYATGYYIFASQYLFNLYLYIIIVSSADYVQQICEEKRVNAGQFVAVVT